MGKVFKSSEEAKKALERAGWKVVRVSKHYTMVHPDVPDIVRISKKHKYISRGMEESVLKALEKTSKEKRFGKD